MSDVRCFWLVELPRVRVSLRRYVSLPEGERCGAYSFHDAKAPFGEISRPAGAIVYHDGVEAMRPPDDDARWPQACERCSIALAPLGAIQHLFTERLYRRSDTTETTTLHEAPVGAMWNAWWYGSARGGMFLGGPQDGVSLVVKTPGGDWFVDGRASNCTLPDDDDHRCWVRHGEPPDVTVDKNGKTCGGGAGSIQAGSYHGFLRNGVLVSA